MSSFTISLTASAFSYGLVVDAFDINTFTLLGEGSGFTYDPETDEPVTGTLDNLIFTAEINVISTAGTEVNVAYDFILLDDLGVDIAETVNNPDPELNTNYADLLADVPLEFPFFDLRALSSQIVADADGNILSAPNPIRAIASPGTSVTGTETRDIFNVADVNRRIDTLDGDDVVTTVGDEASIRVLLRRGDDIFLGDDFDFPGFSGQTTVVNGGAGEDILIGGYGFDTIRAGKDNDVVLGMKGSDKLTGGGGDDFIFGGNDDDQIFGGSGKDVLNGGGGNSVVSGGLGRDVFWHEIVEGFAEQYDGSLRQDGTVTVQDFALGLDQIYLSDYGQSLTNRAEENFNLFMSGSVQDGADTVFDDGNGGGLILKNVQRSDLSVADFFDKPWTLQSETDIIETFL